jgi:STE24 endopeptidase
MELNYVLAAFLAIYILQVLAETWIDLLNVGHAKRSGDRVPPSFEGFIDSSRLRDASSYTIAKSRVGLTAGLVNEAVVLLLILSGFMPALERYFATRELSYISSGFLFFFAPSLILHVIGLPFDYYGSFVVEERFGFNRTTLKLWISDQLKSGLLSVVLFAALLSLILWTIKASPNLWWLWGSILVSSVQLVLVVLYPVLIAPLFNKFEPVKDELLSAKIRKLMEENGIKVKNVLQMNAGLRSRHSNAYFTGLGKTKQIVLYDTLIESHSHDEILSVLAHEIGHFKKKHIPRQLVLFEASTWIGFYLTYLLLDWPLLYSTFGFDSPRPYAGLFFLGIFWQKSGFFLTPLYMALSRKFEREADSFAVHLVKSAKPLATALKKMAADNLSNLSPHPLYVRFHYSHPPLVERIALLEEAESAK